MQKKHPQKKKKQTKHQWSRLSLLPFDTASSSSSSTLGSGIFSGSGGGASSSPWKTEDEASETVRNGPRRLARVSNWKAGLGAVGSL